MKCGKDTYTATTGTAGGSCKTSKGPGGQVENASCNDDKGNGASLSCLNGIGACEGATGAGACRISGGKD